MSDEGDDESFLGALSLVGLLSFCCIGLGAVAGGAVVAGGAAGTTVAIGGGGVRSTLVSAGVTAIAVGLVALVARWRFN